MMRIPARFRRGYELVKSLELHPRYESAFIFGSVAEGTTTRHSDLDVKVVVDQENPCENINHPVIDGYKLDITFRSIEQLHEFTANELKGERRPNLATALIVFDKTGELTKLQESVRGAEAKRYTKADHQMAQFMLYHADNKVTRPLPEDEASSLYSMHANIGEVLKNHYRLNGKWWVSSKRILGDLDTWDPDLAALVRAFVTAGAVKPKLAAWTAIVDHVTAGMGGRQPIAENNCTCPACRADLARLLDPDQ